jgi:hypothetical protein
MGPHRDRLDDDGIEDLLEELFPGAEPEDVEDFMRTLQNFGRQVAPIAQRALPGVAQGAMQGGMVAGPWGALAGALGGGAASLLGGSGARPSPPAPGVPPPPAAPTPLPSAPATAPPGGAAGAPAQLLALLSRPETIQALLALLLTSAGRGTVPVGGRPTPTNAFANAVAETASRVAEAYGSTIGEEASHHLVDAGGHPRCDPFNPAERASLLVWDLLSQTPLEEEDESFEEDEWSTEGDPLDTYEAVRDGRYVDLD